MLKLLADVDWKLALLIISSCGAVVLVGALYAGAIRKVDPRD